MAEPERVRSSGVTAACLVVAALVLAPAVAPPAMYVLLTFSDGDPSLFSHLLLAPMVLLTFHGMVGCSLAFAACAVLGLPLGLAARSAAGLRRKRVWVAAGALGGAGLGLLFPPDWQTALSGAAAGGLTAL